MSALNLRAVAYTVGSLQRQAQMETLLEFIDSLRQQNPVGEKAKELGEKTQEFFQLRPSKKYLSGIHLSRLEQHPH